MEYRKIGNTEITTSILGLGTMRLPLMSDDNGDVDEIKAIEMIRFAIDQGVNYVDTAYPYHDGISEVVVGKALRDGYRGKVTLVTKCPVWLIEHEEDFESYLDEQLVRLETDVIDIYLLHALNKNFWETVVKHNGLKCLEVLKAKGKIKHIGFSFHDDYELFETIIDRYDWDICMLQLNYLDQNVQSGLKGLELASSKNIPVAVMEPLKGGLLANPPDVIRGIFQSTGVERSPVEWSFRWLANRPEVKVILTGASNLVQLEENLKIAESLKAGVIDQEENLLYEKVKEEYDRRISVDCTKCRYCMPCPNRVNIPYNFSLMNEVSIYDTIDNAAYKYQRMLSEDERASQCSACGICLEKCPQNIDIIKHLAEADAVLSRPVAFNTFKWNY